MSIFEHVSAFDRVMISVATIFIIIGVILVMFFWVIDLICTLYKMKTKQYQHIDGSDRQIITYDIPQRLMIVRSHANVMRWLAVGCCVIAIVLTLPVILKPLISALEMPVFN